MTQPTEELPQNTSMKSLAILPPDLVTAIKSSNNTIGEQLVAYHTLKHQETLVAIAALNSDGARFKKHYKYLVEISETHKEAIKIWKEI